MDVVLTEIEFQLPAAALPLFKIDRLEIPSGSKVLIQGPSGRGKSTLLHLIAGLFVPERGSVRLGEHQLEMMDDGKRSQLRRERLGIVFQKLNLIEHLTALENVLLSLPANPAAVKTAAKALDRVGLCGRYEDRSAVLSLGEQQRVAVARALASQPALLLADEPTSSLDEKNARLVIDALFEATAGRTLIAVSHDTRIRERFDHVLDFDRWVPQ